MALTLLLSLGISEIGIARREGFRHESSMKILTRNDFYQALRAAFERCVARVVGVTAADAALFCRS
jgi:hypothetical protein